MFKKLFYLSILFMFALLANNSDFTPLIKNEAHNNFQTIVSSEIRQSNPAFAQGSGGLLTIHPLDKSPGILATENQKTEQSNNFNIYKKVLNNGLTVLVKPTKNVTNVSIELWYNVGSKDEQTDEKGLAHLLEHTIFKGTKDLLSESDIDAVSHKLSGYCNAATCYDWTKYIFGFPKRHWAEALPILADCMSNCSLKQDLLNSEFKAVIQELKMNRDDYPRTLIQEMISTIFSDHPYHYPVIGFKQHIWNIDSKKLYNFYKKHYIPNNAALVIVGDVDPEQAFENVEKHFGNIEPDLTYSKKETYFNEDINSKSVTLYRDVQCPFVALAFVVPGLKKNNPLALKIVSGILTEGNSSRLNVKLVEELQLINNISSDNLELFDYDLFFITFQPKDINNVDTIIKLINEEIQNIINNGLSEQELQRVMNGSKVSYYNLMTNNSAQANMIGTSFLSSGNENAMFEIFNKDLSKVGKEVKKLLKNYLRPSLMHKGYLLPISDEEKKHWSDLQKKADDEDQKFINNRIRISQIEPCKYADSVKSKPMEILDFIKPKIYQMKNGIKVLYHNNNTAPLITMKISLKADEYYDDEDLAGIYSFLTNVLQKGTTNKSSKELNEQLESIGTSLSIIPGEINLTALSSEFEKSLNILNEILIHPKFDETEINKVRNFMLDDLKNFWDNQYSIASHLIDKNIYKNHPYSKNLIGTEESIKKITKKDLVNFYKKYISPKGATLALSGDLSNCDVELVLEKTIGNWQGPEIEEMKYPKIKKTSAEEINHPMNRDQVVIAWAGLSIDRYHADYDKLKIFDQILCGSLGSKLYQLREQTGLFYNISGSLTKSSGLQQGLFTISTTVSVDNLNEIEKLIAATIDNVADSITEQEVREAKDLILNSFINNYSTNANIVSTFIHLDTYNFPFDYYNSKKIEEINRISIEEIKDAVKKILKKDSLIKVRVGRVN